MSTRSRLEALTADLVVPAPKASDSPPVAVATDVSKGEGETVETRFPPALTGVALARTGPGQMLAFRGQMLAVEGELAKLRERLALYADSSPTRRLDPKTVHPSRWANRHPSAFASPAFERLKGDIESAGGNVQPILVRPMADREAGFEIVFGHRRHRACADLGLPVVAVIWAEPLSDEALFAAMERENRERADLSPFEQGAMYQRALDEQLYPSQRRLAEALGVSHTWVRKALTVAQLPTVLIECFRTPLEIQHRHAEVLAQALESDRKGLLRRAEKLRGQTFPPAAVVRQLLGTAKSNRVDTVTPIRVGDKVVGQVQRMADGSLAIKLTASAVPDDKLMGLIDAIRQGLA